MVTLRDEVADAGARLVPISHNWRARFWAQVARIGGVKDFSRRFWITLGRDICYPTTVVDPYDPRHAVTVRHELTHVRQQSQTVLVWWLCRYVTSQSFRFAMEGEAYLIDIRAGASIEGVVDLLIDNYRIGLSRQWMIDWFRARA